MNFGGGFFKTAWDEASDAARASVSAIVTGVEKVGAAAAWVGRKAVDGAKWVAKKTVKLAGNAKDEIVGQLKAGGKLAKLAFEAAKLLFTNTKAGVMVALCAAGGNEVVRNVGKKLSGILTRPGVGWVAQKLLPSSSNLPNDGRKMGAECCAAKVCDKTKCEQTSGSNPVKIVSQCPGGTAPVVGVVPNCPNGTAKVAGKITYVNGINTEKKDLCKTMHALAQATCCEVTGVYNASGGTLADVSECMSNIAKTSESPAVKTLRDQIVNALRKNPPEDLTLFAHSQGGLILQEALVLAKLELSNNDQGGQVEAERLMSHLTVKSFGTAQQGWPSGPNYEQYTNAADPVPGVIEGVQSNYPAETFEDSANIPAGDRHTFNEPMPSIFGPHSMDDVYIEKMKKVHGQPKCCA